MQKFLLGFFVSFSLPVFADEPLLLTKSLNFSSSPNLKKSQILQVGKRPTLMRKIGESNGVTEVEVFQMNGKSVQKKLYISTKWLKKGTDQSAVEFHTDPNTIVNSDPFELMCPKVEEPSFERTSNSESSQGCSVLATGSTDVNAHLECFNEIKEKLHVKSPYTAYKAISKLYTLAPAEQKFMAMILTMFGEARGTNPVQANMAAVMKVIENRTNKAQESDPDLNELDIVLQDAQFSMFNPRDPNWKKALKASESEMRNSIEVFATKQSRTCDVAPPKFDEDHVYHYATFAPYWAHQGQEVKMLVDGEKLSSSGAHRFWAKVPWSFTSSNRYKRYAKKKGLL